MSLEKYRKKRRLNTSPEPKGTRTKSKGALKFVVQKHATSHLHYDFRLELGGALKSWAVPKGPSLDPKQRRLAVHVEDHPLDYLTFEGTIPPGHYGAGEVIVWDIGTYQPTDDAGSKKEKERKLLAGYKKGHLDIELHGKKLNGAFTLVKTAREESKKELWLLIKRSDTYANKEDLLDDDSSALSTRRLAGKAQDKKTPLPSFFKPMLATLADKPFDKDGWYFEIKWDGYRALAFIDHSDICLYSRNENVFNSKFPSLVRALHAYAKHRAVFDGEIVALNEKGMADFQTLQNTDREPTNIVYVIFDLLYLDGRDLRPLPLSQRKQILADLLRDPPPRIMYSDHIEKQGKAFFRTAQETGLEGIIAKDMASIYEPGARSKAWLKMKTVRRQEAVIAGFTEPRGSRKRFGALILGVYDRPDLKYIGHTGGGFDDKTLAEVHKRIQPYFSKRSPFKEKIKTNAPVTWLNPALTCEVKFSEWTRDGTMRHPVFIGLRDDKSAREIVREMPTPVTDITEDAPVRNRVRVSNPDKVFWPKEGYTKGDVINYYEKIAPFILPYLKDRPQSMLRQPNGIKGQSFFQKNVDFEVPDYVHLEEIKSKSENKSRCYLVCDNAETLLYMANLGCIELNPWNSRIPTLTKPDYMILDLDPAKKNFDDLIRVAKEVHKVLTLACQQSYCKTSGKRGLHILVPLGAQYEDEQVRQFAELIVTIVHRRLPRITSIERSPAKRKGNIYLDHLQNRYAQTLAAPYCLRPWPGATVSTPLKWTEIRKGLDPANYTIETIHRRLKKVGDLWEPVLREKVDLRESIACLQKALERTK
jgi:bifunctional non-homologous end joining protein LigD